MPTQPSLKGSYSTLKLTLSRAATSGVGVVVVVVVVVVVHRNGRKLVDIYVF